MQDQATSNQEQNTPQINYSYIVLLSSVAALGGLLFGYDTAVISGAIGYMTTYFDLNTMWVGWAASSALIGCMVGAYAAGWISDKFGRKKALILSAALFLLSALGSAFPRTLTEFIVARIIGGVGVGIASMVSPLYIAEVAPAKIRGSLVTLNQITIVFGMLVVYYVNSIIANLGDESWNILLGWRWMFGSETLPAIFFLLFLLLVPESPRWLMQYKREDEAVSILERVGGPAHAQTEKKEIQNILQQETGSLRQLFQPGFRIALLIGIGLAILQQVTGINVILYFAPKIFVSMGVESGKAISDTVIIGATNMVFTLIALWLVDKVGRKLLLLLASAGMGTCLTFLGFAFMYQAAPESIEALWIVGDIFRGIIAVLQQFGVEKTIEFIILLLILGYIAFFALAMGAVVWVVLSEIFPTQIRGRAMSIAVVILWFSCFLVTQFFPKMLEMFGGNVFFIYAVMCLIAFVFVLMLIPETKGKSLEEIEEHWLRQSKL